MNKSQFQNEHLSIEFTAHEDEEGKLLMVKATAAECVSDAPEPALNIAVVIDRSGSMSGEKLDVAKKASARLIKSLRPIDRIAVVAYDDNVEVLAPSTPPSSGLARLVEGIDSRGSTDLYGGWLKGAKLLTGGGRVLLLSDGLANVGRFQDAANLSEHAECSNRRYGVATSTIGIGSDYDEALMAGMARAGGGFHYFARDAEAIMDAFSRERFLMRSLAVADVKLEIGGEVIELGQLLEGESKVIVVPIHSLQGSAKLRYLDAKTERRFECDVEPPTEFGIEQLATAYLLVERAAELMDQSIRVRSKEEAEGLHAKTRDLQLKVLNHELADKEPLASLAMSLDGTIERLGRLAREFDENDAAFHRKRSMQTSFNIREPGKAFSDDVSEQKMVTLMQSRAYEVSSVQVADPKAFRLRPRAFWLNWPAAPLLFESGILHVGLIDPFDGFAAEALSQELGHKVVPDKRPWSFEEIRTALRPARGGR